MGEKIHEPVKKKNGIKGLGLSCGMSLALKG